MFSTKNTTSKPTFYETLGIKSSATIEEIKSAYRKKSLALHPDKNLKRDTTQEFQALAEAFEVLSDPLKRAEYNISLPKKVEEPVKIGIEKLSELVKNNKLDEIKKIIKHEKATKDWRWQHDDKELVACAVRDAILLGHMDIVKFFLTEKFNSSSRVRSKDNSGNQPLIHFAVESGNLGMVKLLVENRANIEPYNHYHDRGDDSAIKAAVIGGHADIVDYLLEKGASASCTTTGGFLSHGGKTLLAKAAEDGNIRIVESLLKYGASIVHAVELAHEKFEEQYGRYVSAVEGKYGEAARRNLIEYGFGYYNKEFHHNYELKPDVKQFLDKLNKELVNLEKIGETKKNNIIKKLELFFRKYSINLSKEEISIKLNELFKELQSFDQKKHELEIERDNIKNTYERMVKLLLDYAFGIDLNEEKESSSFLSNRREYGGLAFLKNLNVKELNFIGISIEGHPITHEMLDKRKLEGANNSLVTVSDLADLKDINRQEVLAQRLTKITQEKEGIISFEGIVNLVPLVRAVQIGDLAAVTARLKAGANPNDSGEYSEHPPIVFAAQGGYEEIVELLRTHPQFDIKTLANAIQTAQAWGHNEMAEKLMGSQDINQLDEKGDALLHRAVQAGDVDKVQKLIEKGANVNLQGSGGYPLHIAAEKSYNKAWDEKPSNNHIKILQILLKNGANPDAVTRYGSSTALDYAGRAGNVEALKLLLPVTKKIDRIKEGRKNKSIHMPWYSDILFESYDSKEWIEILKLLKAEGADLNIKNEYGTTLLHSVMSDFPSLSQLYSTMRDIGMSIRGAEDRVDKNMLSKTQQQLIERSQKSFIKHLEKFNFLIENGVNPSVGDNEEGDTPVHLFIQKVDLEHIVGGYAKIIDPCISKGFNIDTQNNDGITLLHVAASQNNLTAVQYLLARGADINVKDKRGRTPLHLAAIGDPYICRPYGFFCHSHPNMTEYLITQGHADVHAVNNDGLTPLQYAKKRCDDEIKSDSHRLWSRETQQEWLEQFWKTQAILSRASEDVDFFSISEPSEGGFMMQTQMYIDSFKDKKSNQTALSEFKLSPEDRLSLELYRDDISHEIINIPVKLKEHVYDLETLLKIHKDSKKDPFTGQSFDLTDIQPAKEIAKEIEVMIRIFKERYPVSKNTVSEINDDHHRLFTSPKKQQIEDDDKQEEKEENYSCRLM